MTLTEDPEIEAENRRLARIRELQLEQTINEINDKLPDIERNMTEFWSCLNFIVPNPDSFDMPLGSGFLSSSAQPEVAPSTSDLREEGYRLGVTVPISINPLSLLIVEENDDNQAVLENLKSCYLLLTKQQIPLLNRLLERLSKLGAANDSLKKLIDQKNTLLRAKLRYESLKIKWRKADNIIADDDNDDDDWLDVPSTSQAVIPDSAVQEQIIENKVSEEKPNVVDVKTASTSGVPTLLAAEIPEEASTSSVSHALLHSKEDNIWCSSSHIDEDGAPSKASTMLAEAMSTRTFYYVPKVEEPGEILTCGAPLKNGKKCPRQDKIKCPFHGPIGSWHGKEEVKYNPEQPSTSRADQWRDQELERDITAAIGIDLTGPVKKSRKKTGLTDLKPADNPKNRISKRIFNRYALHSFYTFFLV